MGKSRKKKSQSKLNTALAVLLPTLGVLLLLALVLTFGKLTAQPPEETNPPAPLEPAENPYGPADFAYENGYLTCTVADAWLGIDVSEHQQYVDWEQVKAAGIDFVMIRVGYRGYTEGKRFRDSAFSRHLAGAREAGLDVGVYFFSQAVTPEEAKEEAEFLLRILKNDPAEMGIAFDWEFVSADVRTGNVDGRTMTDCAIAFCQTVAAAGYKPMVYFNEYQALDQYALEELTAYDFWLAMYTDEMTFPYRVNMWQYTEDGTVPGIEGAVDINLYLP